VTITRGNLNKLLKNSVNNWTNLNRMTYGINKYSTMVIKAPNSRIVCEPSFYLAGQPITYLIPFTLKLENIINSTTNKVRKALYSFKGFLKTLIPIYLFFF